MTLALPPFDAPAFQALLDILPGTLHVKDRALRYCAVNRYYLEHWNRAAADFLGRRTTEVFGDEYDAAVEARDRQVLDSGQMLPFYEVEYPLADGGTITLLATKVPLTLDSDRATHVLTLALDISARKRAERELAISEQVRSHTVQRALDGIIATDANGVILEFNRAAEQMFGYRREAVLGRRVDDVIVPDHLRARHHAGMRSMLPGSLAQRGGRRFETEALCADGRIIPIEIGIAEIALDERRIFTASLRDLTEQKRTEAELDQQRRALNQRAKLSALGMLAASISHELKNPLSVVLGQTVLLAESTDDEAVRRRARRIEDAAERCSTVVENFLGMARGRAPRLQAVQLDAVIDPVIELTGHLMQRNHIELHRQRGSGLPDVDADPHLIGQVVVNLLVNAQQALQDAPGERHITVRTSRARHGGVVLEVADSGPGMSQATLEQLFTPFFTTRSDSDGTGLGLAICRDIVARHGGHIHAASVPGHGATFSVSLPASQRQQLQAETTGPHSGGGDRATVLVVDDEDQVRETLAEMLATGGHRVLAAASAHEAMQLIGQQDVDAVLSDFRMPDLDGIAFYQALAAQSPRLARRFALVTGEKLAGRVAAFLQDSGLPALEKPFTPQQARDLVADLLQRP